MQSEKRNSVLIQVENLTLRRQGHVVIDHLSMDLPQTGLMVLLGANGAGKSSLLKLMAGVSQASEGAIHMPESADIAWVPEPASFYRHLTVCEQLLLQADLLRISQPFKAVKDVMVDWGLISVEHQLTTHLSLGYRQRLSIACALLGPIDVLLLDEPMNGMDPDLMVKFKQFLAHFKQHKLVVLATHLMAEISDLTDQAWIMHQGRLLDQRVYIQPATATQLLQFYQSSLSNWQQEAMS